MSNQGKKGRKIGRNAKWCSGYEMSGQREINKRIKLKRHLKTHPNDSQAENRLT